jgi:hypothetical protein
MIARLKREAREVLEREVDFDALVVRVIGVGPSKPISSDKPKRVRAKTAPRRASKTDRRTNRRS